MWYVPHSPGESLRKAAERSADRDEVVELLAEREYPDLERRRVEKIVAAGLDEGESEADADQRRANQRRADRHRASTDERPRSLRDRYADPADVAYLTDDEFARLLGVALERFGGSTVRPEVRDCAVDLFWNRSHDTVGIRTVTRPAGESVGEAVLTEVATGDTTPTQGRTPSRVVAVTNARFSDEAVAVADANDLECYDGAYLGYWLSKARIGRALAGDVLEHGAKREYDLAERVERAPTPPASIRDVEPLEISVESRREEKEDSADSASAADASWQSDSARPESMPASDDRPNPGELGRLYADPDEDGDFGAFDRFADQLDEIEEGD
jgi:hypothetical protein